MVFSLSYNSPSDLRAVALLSLRARCGTMQVTILQAGQSATVSLAVEISAPPPGGAISMLCVAAACDHPDRAVNPDQPLGLQVRAPPPHLSHLLHIIS